MNELFVNKAFHINVFFILKLEKQPSLEQIQQGRIERLREKQNEKNEKNE